MASRASKLRKVSPHCRSFALAKLDGRTRESRLVRETRERLVKHVGGAPSATELAMIERAVQLSLRVALMDERFATTGQMSEHDSRTYLAWSNSLTRTLRELGIKPSGPRSAAPALADYLADRAAAA